jgi:hypothetical protein
MIRAASAIRRVTVALAALHILALSVANAQAAQPWPTTRFEVFGGNPVIGGNVLLDSAGIELPEFEDVIYPLDAAVRDEIERSFAEAARWYQGKGLPPPDLEMNDEGSAYRVYVCKDELDQAVWEGFWDSIGSLNPLTIPPHSRCGYERSQQKTVAGMYLRQCGDDTSRTKIMIVNSDKALGNNGKLNELGYQTIAHELMHAIIANTQLGRSDPDCKVSKWISEGIPDAISYDLAGDIWQGRYTPGMTSEDVGKREGYRPYVESLPQNGLIPIPDGQGGVHGGYTSSSFWRYIARSHTAGWGVLVNSRPNAPPGLLDIGLSVSRGQAGEINWVDDGLRLNFARNLADIYARFVNLIPFHIAPMKTFQGKPAEQNFEPWVKLLFGECEKVDLANSRSQTISLDIKPLASRCIWVEPTGAPGLVQVSFLSMGDDESLFRDITIGRSGTGLLTRATPVGQSFYGQQFIASWRDFPQDGSLRTLYVVSNVAPQPATSRQRSINLTVSRPAHLNSALATVPLPPGQVAKPPVKPSYKRNSRSLSQQNRDTQKMVNEQMNLDKDTLNPNIDSGTTVRRYPRKASCPEPFKYSACGPQILISLSLRPGTYILPGQTNAQGGAGAQVFGGLVAMAQTSAMDTETEIKKLTARLDAIDGSAVQIAIPLIDYGFRGTVPNAAISVAMSGGRTWRAFGPPDAQGRTRLTGSVTIEEFSPLVVRGSFIAPLAEIEAGPQGPVYRSRQTVTGTFTSVAPWQDDERIVILPDSTEQLADDIANTMGVPADMIYSMKQRGTMPGTAPASGAAPGSQSSGGGLLSTDCSCECDMREVADDLCELFCEEEFAACGNP